MYTRLSDGTFEKTRHEHITKEDIRELIKNLKSGIELRQTQIVELRTATMKDQEEIKDLQDLLV